ncbi:hypothetical protein SAMN04489718_3641 [Actinopolyspora saharensis]|uniref:Uncharacterized protein n=1 Tax=Actinopolyspora saharensis TaxID=995062 RepID=A0A1H1GH43_9ACTN|nr:hypothetical protein SAMN04489718_3641 [Actinopolyspora saharensis]
MTAVVVLLVAFGVHLGSKDKLASLWAPKDVDGNPLTTMLTGYGRKDQDDSSEDAGRIRRNL